jgi:hypothetical protein
MAINVEAEFVSMPSFEKLFTYFPYKLFQWPYRERLHLVGTLLESKLGHWFWQNFICFSSFFPVSGIVPSNIPLLFLKNTFLFAIPSYTSALFGHISTS